MTDANSITNLLTVPSQLELLLHLLRIRNLLS